METNCSRVPFDDLTNHNNGGAESAPNSQSTNNDNKQRKRERERARYATMSQEEKNARNLRLREARQKKKEDQNPIQTNCVRAPFGDLTNHTNGGADSAHNSPSANNDNTRRKRERERARYAAKSQEEKNARNLRLREALRKKKGVRCIPKLWCYKYITCNNGCNLDGSRFQGSYKFVGHFNIFLMFFNFGFGVCLLVMI